MKVLQIEVSDHVFEKLIQAGLLMQTTTELSLRYEKDKISWPAYGETLDNGVKCWLITNEKEEENV